MKILKLGYSPLRSAGRWSLRLALFAALALAGAELLDRLSDSTPSFALSEFAAPAKSPALDRAAELRDAAARSLGMPALSLLRFGLSDRLSDSGMAARFNPTNWRITIARSSADGDRSQFDLTLLHEIGHAVAFGSGFAPSYPGGYESLDGSLLALQNFHESFADAFAAAMALRMDPGNPEFAAELHSWKQRRYRSSSAHNTVETLRLLDQNRSRWIGLPAAELPRALVEYASEGSALAIHRLGMEREAYCSKGLYALAKFARDLGYQIPTLPWEAAASMGALPGSPHEAKISALAARRGQARLPALYPDAWADVARNGKSAIEAALIADEFVRNDAANAAFAQSLFPQISRYAPSRQSGYDSQEVYSAVRSVLAARSPLREWIYGLIAQARQKIDPELAASCPLR